MLQPIYLITVNYYAADLIALLRQSIAAQAEPSIAPTLLIVNNSPADLAIAPLADAQTLILEAGANLGFGLACNLGLNWVFAQHPQAIVWLINPDTQLTAGALSAAIAAFRQHPHCAILGTIVETPTGDLWFGGGRFNPQTGAISTADLFAATNADYLTCDWVTGCSLLLNLRQFSQCPQFDRAYFLYYEDFDFCRRYFNQGYTVGITRQIRIIHQPSAITDRDPSSKLRASTDSYLLTLTRYTSKLTLLWRLGRIVGVAIALLPIKPAVAIGKLQGVRLYLARVCAGQIKHHERATAD